jgi:hypothetical protein
MDNKSPVRNGWAFCYQRNTDKPLYDGAELLKEIDMSLCVSSSILNEKIENKPIPKA